MLSIVDELVKQNRDSSKTVTDSTKTDQKKQDAKDAIKSNETIIGVSSLIQSLIGVEKECGIQAFSAMLQATKDACSQAKEIAVKVIGLSKKMTESTDYSSYNESSTFGGDFISAVKLV